MRRHQTRGPKSLSLDLPDPHPVPPDVGLSPFHYTGVQTGGGPCDSNFEKGILNVLATTAANRGRIEI